MNEKQQPFFWLLAQVGAHLGDSVLWVLVTAVLWRQAKGNSQKQHTLRGWTLSLLVGQLVTLLLKQVFQQPRPTGSGHFLYGPGPDVYSFPSGHGVRCGVILSWANALWPGSGKFAPLLVLWVGWARVALKIHYSRDIVWGLFLGMGLSQLIHKHQGRVMTRH